MSTILPKTQKPPAPPRGVAVSGIIFAALYLASLVLFRLAVPADPTERGAWLADPVLRGRLPFALNLVPFTGIAFLWFMGVLRNRIGRLEDQLFATAFLGSGLLFVAMLFVVAALSHGLLDTFATGVSRPAQSESYAVGRDFAYALMNTFAVKMAGVFIMVTSSIGLRTGVWPRWMVVVGFVAALVMVLSISNFAWIALVFPLWVLLLSAYILVTDFSAAHRATT